MEIVEFARQHVMMEEGKINPTDRLIINDLIDYIDSKILINLDEARILNQWLRLHAGLFKEQPDYIHLLRLINGIGSFVDKYDRR